MTGRRYFRYFKFINSFQLAWTSFTAPLPHQSPILEAAKWSFMGFYLFLEAFTIVGCSAETGAFRGIRTTLICIADGRNGSLADSMGSQGVSGSE